ncbi:precursor of CEP5-like [Vicia villosa]|uniref:precursor of CEP5-like n=1 Tax=Vicia villosa TaxID=3911 RepID=UPI00273B9017|nr:precursor of CEP5-like [Vicia villosa]
MAQNKTVLSLIFLALIVFNQGFESIEGRYLKSNEVNQSLMKHNETNNDDIIHVTISVSNTSTLSPPNVVVNGATGEPSPPSPAHDINDFRPTAPGHSPGIGHSVHN